MTTESNTSIIHSNFFTNKNGNTLMKEFEGILQHNQYIKNLDAVVGFLRASGYFSLRPFLDNINRVRILIGIDVDKYIAQAANQGKIFFGAEEEVREECLRKIRRDIESSNYKKEVEEGIFQMIQDLIDGKLELRAHPSKRFMQNCTFFILTISTNIHRVSPLQAQATCLVMDLAYQRISSMSLM